MKQEYFEIGQIVNTFGIKGMVKVNPFTDDITKFERLEFIFIEKKDSRNIEVNKQKNKFKNKIKIEEVKYSKNQVLLKLENVDTVEKAEEYRNCYILIPRQQEEKLTEGTYYIADLIGLNVYSDEEIFLGTLEDIYNTGANDIYVVKNELGKQILLPAIKEVIKQVDLENEKIVVHLLEGLI